MKKFVMLSAALVCATIFVGCGKSSDKGSGSGQSSGSGDTVQENAHEKLIKDCYAVIQSGDGEKAKKFGKEKFDPNFLKRAYDEKAEKAEKVIKTVSGSKEIVKTRVLKTFEENGGKASVVEATCAGTTLYFVVGAEKGKDVKILGYTVDKDEAMGGGDIGTSRRVKTAGVKVASAPAISTAASSQASNAVNRVKSSR